MKDPIQVCRSKRRYATEKESVDALYLRRMQFPDAPRQYHYACDLCGGYHLATRTTGRHRPWREIRRK